jgi:hypothetical protein
VLSDKDKQEAWMALSLSIALSKMRWPDHITQEQIDYVNTCISRNAIPGMKGQKLRSVYRWNCLDLAFAILKAREPNKSDRDTFMAVAKHYGCSWATVRKARVEMRKHDFSFAGRHRELGCTDEDIAKLALPHTNFDNFTDE